MSHTTPESEGFSRRAALIGLAGLVLAPAEALARVPSASLPAIPDLGVPGFNTAAFAGRVTLVNVWASWCPYCRSEHSLLSQIAASGRVRVVGLVVNDSAERARDYLRATGNPFSALSADTKGTVARAFGARGVPNSFLIGRNRAVLATIPGAMTDEVVSQIILPAAG